MLYSAAIRGGLIEAASVMIWNGTSPEYSAAIRGGLIEAIKRGNSASVMICIPPRFAAASLKRLAVVGRCPGQGLYSAAIRGGLIEAAVIIMH